MGDRVIATLGQLEHLEKLVLGATKITDKCSSELERLKHLKTLDLSDCMITDTFAERIMLPKTLEVLQLHRTCLTETGLAKLRAKHPSVRIFGSGAELRRSKLAFSRPGTTFESGGQIEI